MTKLIAELTLPKKDVLTSNNTNTHYYTRAYKTRAIRTKTALQCQGIGSLATRDAPAHLICKVAQDTNRRYDPPNFYPVFKAMIDGLTDAGAWKDDSKDYISHVTFTYDKVKTERGTTKFSIEIEEIL